MEHKFGNAYSQIKGDKMARSNSSDNLKLSNQKLKNINVNASMTFNNNNNRQSIDPNLNYSVNNDFFLFKHTMNHIPMTKSFDNSV